MTALTREHQQALTTIATPVEHGRPLRAYVGCLRTEQQGTRTFVYRACYQRDGGRGVREYVGPEFQRPRAAIEFVDQLNQSRGIGA